MLYERCLRIIYNDKQSSVSELLNKISSVSVHTRNIQRFAIEMFRFYKQYIQDKGGKALQLKTCFRVF